VKFLHATNDPALISASRELDGLKALRNRADYDMNDASVEKVFQARKALDLAKRVMDFLDAVENDLARKSAAVNHITVYKQKTNTP
jgi:hypothetical protein